MAAGAETVLSVVGLRVEYGATPALAGVSLALRRGGVTALVGASGSGKSTLALALLGLLPKEARLTAGSIRLAATGGYGALEVTEANEAALRAVRGRRIAMIFQSPGAALNPVLSVAAHLNEALRLAGMRRGASRREAGRRLLAEVELAPEVIRLYPHQLSGGMQQRVMIALALAGAPAVLVADEPTAALDVVVQAQVLRLLQRLQRARGMAVLFITHDIAVAGEIADEVLVLERGEIVEHGSTAAVLTRASSPAGQRLLAAARALALPATEERG